MHSFNTLNGSQGLNGAGGLYVDRIDQFVLLRENHLNWAGEFVLNQYLTGNKSVMVER